MTKVEGVKFSGVVVFACGKANFVTYVSQWVENVIMRKK